MILIILAIWFGYKKARDTGRNPYLWAAIAAGVFIGTQIVVGLGVGILIAIGQQIWHWDDRVFETYSFVASIPAVILSFIAVWLVFRFLDRPRKVEVMTEPPPPPTFESNE